MSTAADLTLAKTGGMECRQSTRSDCRVRNVLGFLQLSCCFFSVLLFPPGFLACANYLLRFSDALSGKKLSQLLRSYSVHRDYHNDEQ